MVTMKNFFLAFFLLLFGSNIQAQNSFTEVYNREVISFYGDTKFMKDGKILKRSEVRNLLLSVPESAAEYKKFQKNRRISNIIAFASLGLYTGSFVMLSEDTDAALGTLLASAGLSFATLPFAIKSRKNLQQAVFLYNREILKNVCQS